MIGFDVLVRPSPRARREVRPCASVDALARAALAVAAGEQRLGLVIERAQQLALPAVPDAGPDRADVGDGQDSSSFSRSGLCTMCGEVADGLADR